MPLIENGKPNPTGTIQFWILDFGLAIPAVLNFGSEAFKFRRSPIQNPKWFYPVHPC
jgi:hypothetical protein